MREGPCDNRERKKQKKIVEDGVWANGVWRHRVLKRVRHKNAGAGFVNLVSLLLVTKDR